MHPLLQSRELSEPPSVVRAFRNEPVPTHIAPDVFRIQRIACFIYYTEPELGFNSRKHDIVEIKLQVSTRFIAATPSGGGQPCA